MERISFYILFVILFIYVWVLFLNEILFKWSNLSFWYYFLLKWLSLIKLDLVFVSVRKGWKYKYYSCFYYF